MSRPRHFHGLARLLRWSMAVFTIIGHLGAALFPAWVRRDAVFGQRARGGRD